jgi:uncharacterized protein (TIGR02466 family)
MTLPETPSRLLPLFGTPVLVETWPGMEEWNSELFDRITQHRSQQPSVSLSNVHGWQSQTDMLDWSGEAGRDLCDHVLACCDQFTVDLREQGTRRFEWLPEMWANVNEHGASNQTHCHPGSQWSAVYYVQDGFGGSEDRPLGGELVFVDPRMPMIRMRDPDLRFRTRDQSFDHQEVWVRPTTGQLVMFPAWLMHSVRPYLGNDLRVSIALNISSRPTWGA